MEPKLSGQHLWQQYKHAGYGTLKALSLHSAFEAFYMACLAFGEEDAVSAEYARRAAKKDPQNALFRHAATYLERLLEKEKSNVYADGKAFAAFIRSGSNRLLYKKTSAALRVVYEEYDSLNLLDIGAGDGLALLPALHENIHNLTVLEPSATMLQKLCQALDQNGKPPYHAIHSTLQAFSATCSSDWDLIESTFCLHTIVPEERKKMLRWMRAHGKRVLLAEFDAPNFPEMYAPERVRFFIERYQEGIAEYADDGDLVVQGFLMPVFFGNFDRTQARSTYEQPIKQWREDLETAGFQSVTVQGLYSFWWSKAYLLDAR